MFVVAALGAFCFAAWHAGGVEGNRAIAGSGVHVGPAFVVGAAAVD